MMKRLQGYARTLIPFAPLISILGIAAYLRFIHIWEYLTFLGDEGRDVLVIKRMLIDGKLTLLGPTSSVGGFFLGPLYYYLIAPFLYLFGLDPTGPAVFVAICGVVTVYLVYLLAKRTYGYPAAILASFFYASSPLVIQYSRSSWNPNVVPLFSLSLLFLFVLLKERPSLTRGFLIGLILGMGIQLHYVFLFLWVFTGIVLGWLLAKRSIGLCIIPAVIAGVGAGASLFLLFELRHGFPNTISIFRFLTQGSETGFDFRGFLVTVWDLTSRLWDRLLTPFSERITPNSVFQGFAGMVVKLASASVLLGVVSSRVIAIIRKKTEKSSGKAMDSVGWTTGLLIAQSVTVIMLFGLYRKPVYDYYLGLLFPVPFLLLGYGLARLWSYRIAKPVVIVFVVLLTLMNWDASPSRRQGNSQLYQVRKIASVVYEAAEGKPFNFALLSGGNSDHAYRYFFEIWGNPPVTIEFEGADPERRSVTDRLLVVCEYEPCEPLGNPLWEIAGFGRAEIEAIWKVPYITIYRLGRYRGDEL